jgi:hypothetical protein
VPFDGYDGRIDTLYGSAGARGDNFDALRFSGVAALGTSEGRVRARDYD